VTELAAARPTHLAIAFSPGRLSSWVNGEPAGGARPVPGDFFSWKPVPLAFGAEPGERAAWRGTISDVVFWDRPLSLAEVASEAARSAAAAERAPAVERLVVEARVLRSSPAPALASISPYREALAVDEIEIVNRISGPATPGPRLRRVRWAILDGTTLPAPRAGETLRLVLEPFAAQPQLEPCFLADAIGGEAPLWFDLGGTVAP
jgi:hypothetical protein